MFDQNNMSKELRKKLKNQRMEKNSNNSNQFFTNQESPYIYASARAKKFFDSIRQGDELDISKAKGKIMEMGYEIRKSDNNFCTKIISNKKIGINLLILSLRLRRM